MSEIILGYGVFSIGATDIALTRGGGKFLVEREYRLQEADGDYGPVKGRIRKVKSVAKITMNALELLSTNLEVMYPATDVGVVTTVSTWTAVAQIVAADYNATVKFTGVTSAGTAIVIEITDAINLGNIDWALLDKDDVVAEIEYTATYDPATRTVEPWSVTYDTA